MFWETIKNLVPIKSKNLKTSDFFIFRNSLSQDNLNFLNGTLAELKLNPKHIRGRVDHEKRNNRLFIVESYHPSHQKIFNLLTQNLPFDPGTYRPHTMNFYEVANSYALHCDNLGKDRGFYQIVVPLDVSPPLPTYTILFDQTSEINTEWIAPVYGKPDDYQPFHNVPIRDPNFFGNWSDGFKIPDSDGKKYWGSKWNRVFREAYKGFSIKLAYQWNVGDIFCFNSRFTHCASEMEELGIESKTGLLLCLEKVPQKKLS